MTARVAPPEPPRTERAAGRDRYPRMWTTAAVAAAVVWMSVAVLQSPWLPLLGVAGILGLFGGLVHVSAPARSERARLQFLEGAALIAGGVLVVVGIGHHLAVGLAVVGLLAAASPWSLRWISGSERR